MGDKGTGALRQRVHGVVDLYGDRKGSFRNLRRQASPIQSAAIQRSSAGTYQLTILTRTALPAYTLSGYSVRWSMYGYDGLPMAAEIVALRTLYPGEEATVSVTSQLHEQMRITADVCRPDGRSVLTVDYLDEAADA